MCRVSLCSRELQSAGEIWLAPGFRGLWHDCTAGGASCCVLSGLRGACLSLRWGAWSVLSTYPLTEIASLPRWWARQHWDGPPVLWWAPCWCRLLGRAGLSVSGSLVFYPDPNQQAEKDGEGTADRLADKGKEGHAAIT